MTTKETMLIEAKLANETYNEYLKEYKDNRYFFNENYMDYLTDETYNVVFKVINELLEDIIVFIDPESIHISPYSTFIFEIIIDSMMISIEIGKEKFGYFTVVDNITTKIVDSENNLLIQETLKNLVGIK